MKTLKNLTQGHDVSMWQRVTVQAKGLAWAEGTQGQVIARVNHGRWIANCPFCAGAELVEPGEIFFCLGADPDGGMAKNGNHPMAVVFPENRAEIEQALQARPIENQNWESGETISDLVAENVEMLQ